MQKTSKGLVVMLCAEKESGKTTCAKMLQRMYNAEMVSFAGPLKELTLRLIPQWGEQHVYGTSAQKELVDQRFGFSPRQFMQRLGNEARLLLGDTVWIRGAVTSVEKVLAQNRIAVIDDCRYANELDNLRLRSAGGEFDLFAVRLINTALQFVATDTHASETELKTLPRTAFDAWIESAPTPGAVDLLTKFTAALWEPTLCARTWVQRAAILNAQNPAVFRDPSVK